MPAWIWFVVALVAAAGGAALLWFDRDRPTATERDRRAWASSKGWEFTDAMSSPPHAWRYGTLRGNTPRAAYDVATGAVPGPDGRRLGCVFDQEQDGETIATVAAVRGTVAVPVAIELRRPESPGPDDDDLDNLGQLGRRWAFVSNAHEGRRLLTDRVVAAADRVGADVPLVWAEDTWVLASTRPDADPDRVEALIEALVELSAAVRDAVEGRDDDAADDDDPVTDEHTRDRGREDDDAPTAAVASRAGVAGASAATGSASGASAATGSAGASAATGTGTGASGQARDDTAATTTISRDAGRSSGTAHRDDDRDDPEIDDDLEGFASGDEDASPYSAPSPADTSDTVATAATHRERPDQVPYDHERDDPEPEGSGTGPSRSSRGSTWRSGPFRGR